MAALVGGCARRGAVSVSSGEPLGLQMVRTEAQLKKHPFRTLLEFEVATDAVFVRGEGAGVRLDAGRNHTGAGSLAVERGAKGLVVRLASLLGETEFPGRWTLAGAYFWADRPQRIVAAYEVNGATLASAAVQIPGGQWTPVLLDVASAVDGKGPLPIGNLRFSFGEGLGRTIWCDDVLVMDNTQVLVEARSAAEGWTIRERGFAYTLERQGVFRAVLKTPEAAAAGWTMEEANEIRARFVSRGSNKSRTIYWDGREIVEGSISALAGYADAAVAQHAAPAAITVAEEMGRLNRNSAGDANNDGYAERTGAYQVIAAGARLEMTIRPEGRAVARPVVEIANLPAGEVLVTMEGRLVEKVVRLEDGRVLVALPGVLERAVMVNVRVRQ